MGAEGDPIGSTGAENFILSTGVGLTIALISAFTLSSGEYLPLSDSNLNTARRATSGRFAIIKAPMSSACALGLSGLS